MKNLYQTPGPIIACDKLVFYIGLFMKTLQTERQSLRNITLSNKSPEMKNRLLVKQLPILTGLSQHSWKCQDKLFGIKVNRSLHQRNGHPLTFRLGSFKWFLISKREELLLLRSSWLESYKPSPRNLPCLTGGESSASASVEECLCSEWAETSSSSALISFVIMA